MSWFQRTVPSREIAKERLKLILVHDRSLLSDDQFERMKEELVNVLSKYFEIEKNEIKIDIQRDSPRTVLEATVPVISVKRSR